MALSIEQKIANTINGHRKGWAFSQKDFVSLGSRRAVDLALHRLVQKGKIRRVIRGIYDFPRYSEILCERMNPAIDQVAQALARKFGWQIQPSGPSAMNIIGLSTQVPSRYVFQSDGPDRSYTVEATTIEFKNTVLKESKLKLWESILIVRALKSLGKERIDSAVIAKIREWLDPGKCSQVMKDTQKVTGWVYEAIREVCQERGA